MTPQLEIQLIAVVTAVACALPGVFLVLRRMALMSDAITHAVLFGIVLAFFAVQDIGSPLLMVGAAATGVLTVVLVELLGRTQLVREDAAIGLVFPVLFSVAVILIARYAGGTHLDVDAVLLGELAFAPFDRFEALGVDLGPRALWVMGAILLATLVLVGVLYKELKLATFDAGLAAALGFSPALIHYGLMTLVSVTAVGAFDSVGSVLVVALMIAPPAAAYLLTDRLAHMLGLSALIGVGSALAGVWLAIALDASIAGAMATTAGVAFGLAWLFAPERGLIAVALRRARQRREFAELMLAVHLLTHEQAPDAAEECRVTTLGDHLRWPEVRVVEVTRRAAQRGLVTRQGEALVLTERGRTLAQETVGALA
jgi:manganese/zinc/iron transport system permease protein